MLDALYDLIIGPLILVIEISFSILWRLLNDEGLAVVGLSIVVSLLTLPLYPELTVEEIDRICHILLKKQ